MSKGDLRVEGKRFTLKDKPYPYAIIPSPNEFFNTP
jgi:hypothetical protein